MRGGTEAELRRGAEQRTDLMMGTGEKCEHAVADGAPIGGGPAAGVAAKHGRGGRGRGPTVAAAET